MKIFASHNPDEEIRRQSSSGGIFTILAEKTISLGGIVYGAAFDSDWNVIHKRIDTIHDISALRGSKYVFSDATKSYSDVVNDLDKGYKVMFSGTPCQIAAMKKRAGDNPKLLLVETVCHGAPMPKFWTRYLTELLAEHSLTISDIKSINFRDKSSGWKNYSFTIQFNNNKKITQRHYDNPYMKAFIHGFTLREACFKCPFKYPNGTKADITLGDLWGIDLLAPSINNDKGTTLVIIRNPRTVYQFGITNFKNSIPLSYLKVTSHNQSLLVPTHRPIKYDKFQKEYNRTKSTTNLFKKYTSLSLLTTLKIKFSNLICLLKKRTQIAQNKTETTKHTIF